MPFIDPGTRSWVAAMTSILLPIAFWTPTSAAGQSLETLKANFADPPIEYHTVPSWWFDGGDPIEADRVNWQLEQLKSQGIDVVCLFHLGPLALKPPYQTEQWWSQYRQLVKKAASLDMKIWMSDGIGWGSPLINNTVMEEDPSYGGQILDRVEANIRGPDRVSLEIPKGPEIVKVLGAFAYPSCNGQIDLETNRNLTARVQGRKLTWETPPGDWTVMIFYSKPGFYQPMTNFEGFLAGGRGKALDYMNPRAMKRLLDVTIGEFERQVPDHMGKTVVADFQDELLTTHGFPPISPLFFPAFQKWKGYDIMPHLAAMFRDAGRLTPKVRCDYFDVWVRLLEDAFFKPQFQWYGDRGMMIAHDQYGRGTLIGQLLQYGDYFRTMRWYQAPGGDDWHEARPGRNLRDIKLASSIAHLYERPHVFSEALHTAGWGLTMEQQLQVVNEEYVMGVNLYDEILFNYTTHGSRFEWAPAATMFRQPYFRYKRLFNDYVNRLSYIMSRGKHVADVAILYPVTTLQANISAGGPNQIARLTNSVSFQLAEKLFYDRIDFDFIDYDSILRADISQGRLKVAGESYRILLLPPLTAIRQETLGKIAEFWDNGGMVIGMTLLPTASPKVGDGDPQVIRHVERIFGLDPTRKRNETAAPIRKENNKGGRAFFLPEGFRGVTELIRTNLELDVVTGLEQVLTTHRRTENRDFYLIYNRSNQPISGEVRVRALGQPEWWNPETGTVRQIFTYRQEQPYTSLEIHLEAYQARLFALDASGTRTSVEDTDLSAISIASDGEDLVVTGTADSPGSQNVSVLREGRRYEASVDIADMPSEIHLDGPWKFTIEPTLDNRWGDFRLPVTEQDRMIGAEVREFLYRQEAVGEDGQELGWAKVDLDDSLWEKTVYTVGPYWWVIPPISTRGGPAFFDNAFIPETNIDTNETYTFRDWVLRWQPYSFSQEFGIHRDVDSYRCFGACKYVNVNSDFIDLGPVESFAVAYAYTHVFSPEAMSAMLSTNAGGYMEPIRIWVNDEVVSDQYLLGPIGTMSVSLEKGWNEILVKVMHFPWIGSRRMRFYVYLEPEDEVLGRAPSIGQTSASRGPRLRWFAGETPFIYDLTPFRPKRVGWYRFMLPPGTIGMKLDLFGRAKAFVDEEEVSVSEDGTVRLSRPAVEGTMCAIRIEQEQGRYAGAAFRSPVRLEFGEGFTLLGDWSQKGLFSYSGIGIYTTEVEVPSLSEDLQWELDLGEVKTTAEVVVNGKSIAARAWGPYRVDLKDALRQGTNTIQIKVANTLANHGLIGTPWMFIYEGNERSGLIGPVVLRPSRKVSVRFTPGDQ